MVLFYILSEYTTTISLYSLHIYSFGTPHKQMG